MTRLNDIYFFDGASVCLEIHVDGLPTIVTVEGIELSLKTEFHITLINVKRISMLIDLKNSVHVEAEILDAFKDFIKTEPLENYKLSKTFRFVQRDEKKTVIAMAEVPHLSEFFDMLRQKYKKDDIPNQPTHSTLYTLQPNVGIGLLSNSQLNSDSKLIELPELKNMQFIRKTIL